MPDLECRSSGKSGNAETYEILRCLWASEVDKVFLSVIEPHITTHHCCSLDHGPIRSVSTSICTH